MATIYKRNRDKGKKRAPWYIGYRDHKGKWRYKRAFTDKAASEKLAAKLEEEARKVREGLLPASAIENGKELSIDDVLRAFDRHLASKDVSDQHQYEVVSKIRRVAQGTGITTLAELEAERIENFLALLRGEGLSKRTSNHYVKALRQFATWLVRTRRLAENPLSELRVLNAETDRRHKRRPLTYVELALLVQAAEQGGPVESISGKDRGMMYILAAWTGYRKGEIGSLKRQSFDLDSDPATVTVEAVHSKRRKLDTQVLHADVAATFRVWLAERGSVAADELLFPVSGKVPGGTERKTAKMMQIDLAAARSLWMSEAADAGRARRARAERLF